jgi:hypothetical protein
MGAPTGGIAADAAVTVAVLAAVTGNVAVALPTEASETALFFSKGLAVGII